MKTKTFKKYDVKKKVEKLISTLESRKLMNKQFPMSKVLGDYQFNSRNRYIKEALFTNLTPGTRVGTWAFNFPKYKKDAKKLAQIVMDAKNIS